MDFSKEHLLASGFTAKELQMLQNNIDNFGGTFEEVIRDLGRRFKRVFSIIIVMFLLFTYVVFFESIDKIISLGISLFIGCILVTFIHPPIISFKCWRFCMRQDNE